VVRTTNNKRLSKFGYKEIPVGIIITVINGSEKPIRELVFSWHKGTDPWSDPDHLDYLLTATSADSIRGLPDDVILGGDNELFSAVVYFRDADKVYWCATPNGDLTEQTPD
jgi:hypothetical protein